MRALILATLLLAPQLAAAGVFMCVDPATGKKTFTDSACPEHGTGEKVKVQTTNFGEGIANKKANGTWNSHRDTSMSGRDYKKSEQDHSRRGLATTEASADLSVN